MLTNLIEQFKEDTYARAYGKAFTDKIAHLAKVITEEYTQPNEFNVFALEAGLGKSNYTTKIIDENLNDWKNARTYLIVKRFKEDVVDMEKALRHHNPPEGFGNPTVLGITGDNWSKWREQHDTLKRINVIIITHKRYIDLCLDDKLRETFTQNREVLIIDEKVNFPIYSFSEKYYAKIRELLSIRLQELFDKVCKTLRRILEKKKIEGNLNKCVRVEPKIHPSTLKNFINTIELNIKDTKNIQQRNVLQHFIDGLEHFYNEMCIYNGGNIITFNRKHKLWGLKNNIILDASASIDGVYHVSDDFYVIGKSRIIDHSESTFYTIPFNTSKSNLQENQGEYYKEIAQKIIDYDLDNDQTLIICHKDNYPKIEEQLLRQGITDIHIANESLNNNDEEERQDEVITQKFAINWFGNIIGKNAYGKFTNCWIIGTPNIPLGQYLMHYMMYTRKKNLVNKKLDVEVGKFKNEEFSKVQNGFVASEIYQSLKRIQRNIKPNGNFFIVNSNNIIINSVLGQFKGVNNREEIQLDFAIKQKQNSGSNNVDLFIDYMRNYASIGEHSKKEICKNLSISHLYRVLKADRIKALEKHELIKINKHSIEKLKNWNK